VHNVSVFRQIEIHTAELLIHDPSAFEVKMAITKLKRYKLPGSDHISAELFQADGEILQSEIRNLINSFWNKEELPDQWKESYFISF
jgi:hypothetical protein